MRDEVDAIRVIDAPLPNNWESATFYSLLKEGSLDLVQDGNHGGSYPKAEEFESSGVPLITGADLNDGAINLKDCKFLKPTSAEKLRIGFAKQGDVLLTHKGTMGKTAIVPPLPCPYIILNPQITLYRVSRNGRLNNRFLKYFFDGAPFQAFLERISGISTISTLSLTVQKSIEIPVPPLPEQRTIAHILGTLDDKIELNHRRNQTLEAMARALFKDWFVDFGPVRAKMEERAGQDGLVSGQRHGRRTSGPTEPYLPADLWQLFPDRLDNEGKPEGWRYATLASFASLNPESWTKKNAPHEIRYVDLSNTKQGTIEGAARMPWSEAPSRAQRVLRPGDTIVGTVRPGNKSFALIADEGMTGSTGFAVLRPLEKNLRDFVFLTATSPANIERLTHLADGAAYPAVRPDVVLASPITVPSGEIVNDILRGFANVVSGWVDAVEKNKQESKTLAKLRDTLLPKLISGELRIADADQFLENRQ